ncbi:hypothetical protein EUX98_g3598 [Antrodiella citrinella]|uniref:Uncharacterized protein n=1 Tax=Antrodiella citrinella TaxID=2447956 RepID=A0A4V3XIV2_9APHY|nr:hypothetical protein EUX98_g3598 [Antrodiella citrinella]
MDTFRVTPAKTVCFTQASQRVATALTPLCSEKFAIEHKDADLGWVQPADKRLLEEFVKASLASPETHGLAPQAQPNQGDTLHEWLDKAIVVSEDGIPKEYTVVDTGQSANKGRYFVLERGGVEKYVSLDDFEVMVQGQSPSSIPSDVQS